MIETICLHWEGKDWQRVLFVTPPPGELFFSSPWKNTVKHVSIYKPLGWCGGLYFLGRPFERCLAERGGLFQNVILFRIRSYKRNKVHFLMFYCCLVAFSQKGMYNNKGMQWMNHNLISKSYFVLPFILASEKNVVQWSALIYYPAVASRVALILPRYSGILIFQISKENEIALRNQGV